MFNPVKTLATGILIGSLVGLSTTTAYAVEGQADASRHVDLAIALDVSGSMEGLIESAKQRLWDIANELGRAEPQPVLRVAILSYGNPTYGPQTGFVRIDQHFTRDLDAVNETLFGFETNGGDEYVARAIHTSVNALQWSNQPDALRVIFIAGNESAEQDPWISIEQASRAAADHDVFVNTIYCGADSDGDRVGWQDVAKLTEGMYATIDQHVAAVGNIQTPMDEELATLNQVLNDTYVPFGRDGATYSANQRTQDNNAREMSRAAAASRAITKASNLYNAAHWDLVDAVESGTELETLDDEELPREMRAMSLAEKRAYIRRQTDKRAQLQSRISELDQERRGYISRKRAESRSDTGRGLDDALQEGLRSLAEKKGFEF